ncbi:hypothetical protein KUTeg_009604 [Tegillarca granosa]|uniref:Uncharacterized protein n=1 Tax=Tegillarca granosa TaxID=220873 RepID=A0ABQ9F4D5_TEGGR|nr:hypothetical protein KUTeg_009604 [Tegillarca granosa]
MAGNGETATNLSQQEDKVVPLELVNGSELDSAQEGSGGDVVNEVKQDGDGNQFAASGGGDGKGESENLKTEQDIVSKPADPQEKVTDGNTNGEYEQYSKLEENSKGVDIDKDVDEADKNTIKIEGDIGQSEMIVMDCFPAQQNSQIADEKEINKDILDNSVASSCNVEEEDGYATTDTDTSQIARDLVQHALDQAILTFHTDASSVPSLSSTQELNSEDSSHDMENNNINIEQSKNDKKTLETQDSVEEVETEVTFESIKQTNESIVSLNDSQEIGDDNEDDSMRELNDTEDAENKGKSSDQQQRLQENGETELLVSAEKMSDRGDEDSDASDAEFGGLAKLDPLPQYPDFPENYGNYKVCRTVEPGVKECIILETGECVRCKKSYSGICKTGKCTAVNNKEEIVSKAVNLIPIHDNDDGQLINDIPKNEVRSPNVSLSSASSNESGKAKTFRIDKSPKKDGKNAYSVTISEFNRNHDISSNLVQNDRTGLVNDENSVASFANDNERQFAYLDNLRSSRQEEFVLNNNFVPKTTVNSQKPPSDISYSQLSANNEDDIVTYPRSSQYRRETQNTEFSYQRIPNSEAQQMPQSFSSSSLYNRKYESSPLSDPSVLVRYQRNLISRDFPTELSGDTYQNVTQTSSLSDNDRINSQRKVEDRKLEFTKDQFELNQSERELLREIYSKYGQPREQMQDSFVSSASGDYSRNKSTQELLSSSNSSGHIPSYKTLHEQQVSDDAAILLH